MIDYAEENGGKMVDMRFCDFRGVWQNCSMPMSEFDEDMFEDGHGFDDSSIRG